MDGISYYIEIFIFISSVLGGAGVVDSAGKSISPIITILGMGVGVPIIALLQGILISCLCYFGIIIYRKVRKL